MLRHIPAAASAVPQVNPTAGDPDHLASQSNKQLYYSLRADTHEEFLMAQTLADAELGRVSDPLLVEQLDVHRVLLSRRFSRDQGMLPNGDPKLRAVDDLNGINGCAQA